MELKTHSGSMHSSTQRQHLEQFLGIVTSYEVSHSRDAPAYHHTVSAALASWWQRKALTRLLLAPTVLLILLITCH